MTGAACSRARTAAAGGIASLCAALALVACGSQSHAPANGTSVAAARLRGHTVTGPTGTSAGPTGASSGPTGTSDGPTGTSDAVGAPPPAPAPDPAPDGLTAMQADFIAQLEGAGPLAGAYVYDLTARRPLFSWRADMPQAPASVEKLYTSTAALVRLGPSARLDTTVLGTGYLGPHGEWHGDLFLDGGGDPTLGSATFNGEYEQGHGATLEPLVRELRADGIRRVSGHVIADPSLFDDLPGPPSSGYEPDIDDLGGELSALTFDHGASGPAPAHGWDQPITPATYANLEFTRALRRAGIAAKAAQLPRAAPVGAQVLASETSPPLSVLLGLMNPPSDDFYAEMLVKQLGARFEGAGTTAAGAAVVSEVLDGYGIHPHVVDGSGLSRADHTTPAEVVRLLAELTPTPIGVVLRHSLAVAGRTGTLAERMVGTVAAGRCQAKTGTLDDVSNLAGWCRDLSGHLIAFAIFMRGFDIGELHTRQDHMLITLVRDDPSRP